MPKVTFVPGGKQISVRPGITLLEASRKANAPVRSRCSGGLSCLMCKVKVLGDGSGLTANMANERAKLGKLELEGYRFSCQARIIGDAVVELPEDPLKAAIRAQLLKQQEEELW